MQDNGGPIETHALLPGSPAIDAGDNASCPDTDQRGVTRPQGVACDIGAFESGSSVTATVTATPTLASNIAFQSDRDGDSEIYVMDADGSNVTQLTFVSAVDSYPDWSPSGI